MATSNAAVAKADEGQIRRMVEEWRQAIRSRDLDRLESLYATDMLFFDVIPPYVQSGAKAYRATWEGMFRQLPPRVTPYTRDAQIHVSGDLAVMHGFTQLVNADTQTDATMGWVRVTVVYQRTGGEWKVIHEHVSVPIDPKTGKGTMTPRAVVA
jgi:uncharacterized protein (TIGR02246 family)